MAHRYNAAEYAARKVARQTAAANHGTNASVKDRLDIVEIALGLAPATKEKK